jgi:hypothetical protein
MRPGADLGPGIEIAYLCRPVEDNCPVAQLAERLTLDQEVPGSNPGRAAPDETPRKRRSARFRGVVVWGDRGGVTCIATTRRRSENDTAPCTVDFSGIFCSAGLRSGAERFRRGDLRFIFCSAIHQQGPECLCLSLPQTSTPERAYSLMPQADYAIEPSLAPKPLCRRLSAE